MESFRWDPCFLTGLDAVDSQHQRLVELINRLGALLDTGGEGPGPAIGLVLTELTDYTQYHFSEEEVLMLERGVDHRHLLPHREAHRQFIDALQDMRASVAKRRERAGDELLRFLTHWLAHHILGTDKSLARQLAAMNSGQSAADAYVAEEVDQNASTGPLLRALNGLFQLVTSRNRELSALNRTLEERVRERTRDLCAANARLEAAAMTDPLTGLPNRRHALSALGRQWKKADREGCTVACMMIDADGFKQVNDGAGHDAGDEVLRRLARTLKHSVRTDDLVARLGGDEFLIVCPCTDLDGVLQVAEKVRAAVAELRVPVGDGEWRGSISVGVSVRDATMQRPEALVKSADEGVYLAKRAGRDCVRSALGAPDATPLGRGSIAI